MESYPNSQNPNRATEYRCALCRVTHLSDEDQHVFEAHKDWHRNLHVATIPDRYFDWNREFRQ